MTHRLPTRALLSIALVLALAAGMLTVVSVAPASGTTGDDALINELFVSQTSTDDTEFVEIFGTPGFSLDGLSIVEYEADVENPSYGAIDTQLDFGPGDAIGPNGFFLAGNPVGLLADYGVVPDFEIPSNTFENSSATYALVTTASIGGTLVVLDGVHLTDDDLDPSLLLTEAPSVGPDGSNLPAGVRRAVDGVDTDASGDWLLGDWLLGAANTPTSGIVPPEPTVATIMEIQGAGHLSPFDGELVTTTGVVTAIAFNGFYLQDPFGDGDVATSDGIFVSGGPAPAIGNAAEITGGVSEVIGGGAGTGNLSTTQLAGAAVVDLGSDAAVAATIIGLGGRVPPNVITISDDELPVNLQDVPGNFDPDEDGIDFYESMEGMLVTLEDAVAISATRRFSTFSAEFFTLPNQGTAAIIEPNDARTPRGGIFIQAEADGYGDLNPERVQIQLDPNLYEGSGGFPFPGLDLGVKVGDLVGDVTGVMGYSFGNFEINAIGEITVTDGGLSEETTKLKPKNNHLLVASYNVLNLSAGDVFDDEGDDDVDQVAELGTQIANNLNSPDVIALQEIQDDSGEDDDGVVSADATLQMLIDAIAAAGGPDYLAFNVEPVNNTQGGAPGANIRNAFLYNPDTVDLLGFTALDAELLTAAGADPASFDGTRIPLIGLFEFNDAQFTMISVHNSSRFGSTPIFGGPQPFVQAGEAEREAQTKALNAYVDFRLQVDPGAQIVVAGDFNTFEFTDELLEDLPGPEPVLTNLVPLDGGNGDYYSFIFDGNSQMLDHMFVTNNLLPSAKLDTVHVNVDFPRIFSEVTGSDHEPLVATLRLKKSKPSYTLSVLHNNDGESQLIDAGSGLEDFGGVARFATVVDNSRAAAESCDTGPAKKCGSIFVSSGDNFLAGAEFNASVNDGIWYDAIALDMLGYDAIQLGNHDFDFGPDTLAAFISEGFSDPGTPPYIAANLDFTAEAALQALADDGVIVASTVVKEDKEEFGIVGVITPNLPFISSPGGTLVDDALASIVQAEVDAFTAAGIDKIVFISHLQGIGEDMALAAMLDGVDVMVAGGGDEVLANPGDLLVPGDEAFASYPLLATDMNGTVVPVVTTAGNYKYLGALEVDWDSDGNVVGWSGGPIRIAGGAQPDAVTADAAMQSAVVDPVAEYLAVLATTVVATSDVGLDALRPHIRSVETNEGNLIGDAYFWQATQKAGDFGLSVPDVALTNGGGIRNDSIIPPGDLTVLNTFNMLPFANFVTIVPDVSRADFWALIEQAVSAIESDGTGGSGRFAQISHFTVTYDSSAPAGARVSDIVVDGPIGAIVSGGVLVAGPDLTVATNAFSAGGGDNWFGGPPGDTGRVSLGVTDQQALQSFMQGPLGGSILGATYPLDAGIAGSCKGARIVNMSGGCLNQF